MMLIRHIVAFSLLFLASFGYAQRRDSTLLEEVVVTDTRLFDKETAGGKQTKVDSLVLAQNINHTLSELLSENTSVFIKSYGRGSMATASFRGTAPSHTQVLWNGLSINSPMLGMVDFSLIPVYFIDDLQLKHGGASIEDIGGALGGSISISNKTDWNNTFSGRFVQGVGSFSTWEEFVQINAGNKRFQSKTRAYYTKSKNDFPFVNDAKIGAPTERNPRAAYMMYSIMQEFAAKINDKNKVSLDAWFHQADRSIPRLNTYLGADSANVNTQDDRTLRIHGGWDHLYRSGTVKVSVAANIQDLNYFLENFISGSGFGYGIYSISRSKSFISRIDATHDFSPRSSLRLSVNVNRHDVATYESVKKTGYKESRNEVLSFLDFHKNIKERVNLRAFIRQDYVDDRFIPIIPYFGFDVKVFKEHNIFIKGNITRNYHVPTLNDLYWQPGGNPDLKPEEGITQELTIATSKKIMPFTIESQLTGFYSDINNWILWVPTFKGPWQPFNIKKVIAKGIEASVKAKYHWTHLTLSVNANYALTRSLNYGDVATWGDESYGKQLVYIPVHSGNLFANVQYKNLSLTYQHNSYSRRFTTSSNELTKRGDLPNYFMNQIYLGKEFKVKRFTFEGQLKIYNLFDEYYRSVLDRRMPGRNYMLLLMARF